MKKISLAMIAAALALNTQVAADPASNFGGFTAKVMGQYGSLTMDMPGLLANTTNVTGSTLTNPLLVNPIPAGAAASTPPADAARNLAAITGLAKGQLDLGFTKVMANNMLVGASILGGWDFFDTGIVAAGTDDVATALPVGMGLKGSYGGALQLQLGYVVMPKCAIKVIGEVSYYQYTLTTNVPLASTTSATTSQWFPGASVGAAIDVALTDRILFTVGGMYDLYAPSMAFTASTATPPTNNGLTNFNLGKSWNIFAGLGFRITQD